MNEQNKMLKEKLVSHLRFEPERAEVLLMVKGKYIVCEPTDSSEKDNSELSSSLEKKYPILHTAVYRPNTERKNKATIKVEGVYFGNVLSRMHKEGREESVCQPTNMSEHETMKLKRSIIKPASLMSKNEILKKTLPATSACKDVQPGFGTPASSSVHAKVPKMAESGVIEVADYIQKTEMQTAVLEPSCHEKTCEPLKVERSSKKLLRTKVHSYDRTEPIDDDVIIHILRLRGKLGWQTELPSCERLAREADVARFQKFTLTKPLLLKDSGEYIYCLERNRKNFKVPYNPYDLEVVSTNTALQSKEYWTITASFVSKFSADHKLGEMEITPVPQWLRERHLYSKLLNLNFFSNFRMKKCFLVWKINARRSKENKTKSI
ncbi:dynein axonemal heavy chain 14 [Strix uralensis]|uniref:dynein axonemal heavy chain 14 n=1 Tax=Strix uralensis TaxID=36305 RepID=UPI003DA6F5A4